MLPRLVPWASQPQGPAEVDSRFGINEAWVHHVSPRGLVRFSAPTVEASYSRQPTPDGIGFKVSATGRRYPGRFFSGQSVYGWLAVMYRDGSGSATYSIIRHASAATPIQEASSAVRGVTWPGGVLKLTDYVTPGGVGIANYHNKVTVFAGRVDAASAKLFTLVDGQITESTISGGVGTLSTTTNPLVFGAAESGGEVATPWSNLATLFWAESVPTEDVLRYLMREKWSAFAPRRAFITTAAGGGPGAQSLTPTLYSNAQTFYTPTVSAGAVSLAPALYSNAQTFYTPTVTRGSVSLAPTLYSNAQAFYSATVTQGAVLAPALYSNSQAFYAPTVSAGAVTLTPALYSNAQSFYSATVLNAGQILAPGLYSNAQAFYSPTVGVGSVTLTPALFTNSSTFYAASVSDGAASGFIKYFDVLSGRLLILRAL